MSTIDDLLAEAAPLRELDPDDPKVARLAVIVDEINRLRAIEDVENRERAYLPKPVEPIVVPGSGLSVTTPVPRGPGRPRKETQS